MFNFKTKYNRWQASDCKFVRCRVMGLLRYKMSIICCNFKMERSSGGDSASANAVIFSIFPICALRTRTKGWVQFDSSSPERSWLRIFCWFLRLRNSGSGENHGISGFSDSEKHIKRKTLQQLTMPENQSVSNTKAGYASYRRHQRLKQHRHVNVDCSRSFENYKIRQLAEDMTNCRKDDVHLMRTLDAADELKNPLPTLANQDQSNFDSCFQRYMHACELKRLEADAFRISGP